MFDKPRETYRHGDVGVGDEELLYGGDYFCAILLV